MRTRIWITTSWITKRILKCEVPAMEIQILAKGPTAWLETSVNTLKITYNMRTQIQINKMARSRTNPLPWIKPLRAFWTMQLNISKTRSKALVTIQIFKELTIVKISHSTATRTPPTEITLCEILQTWITLELEVQFKMLRINIFQNNSRFMPKTTKEWIQTETRRITEFLKLVSLIVLLEIWIKKGQMSLTTNLNHQLRLACNLGTPNLKSKLRSIMLWTILWRLHLHLLKQEDFKIQEL